MCYNITTWTKQPIEYAKHRSNDQSKVDALEKKFENLIRNISPHYFVNAYAHPKLLVFTNEKPAEPQAITWGLIPFWAGNRITAERMCDRTFNARGETIFERSAFKNSAKNRRCLIYLDAFYEYHHINKKVYPFHISMKDDSPLVVAGLWDEWVDKENGEVFHTCSIVTTKANQTMSKIHNNPRANEPRMPAILHRDKQDNWLLPIGSDADKNNLLQLLTPFDNDLLKYYTVQKLTGYNSVGDKPEAEHEVAYPELKGWDYAGK
jgi:putative SOS response-associated peptidase YedK